MFFWIAKQWGIFCSSLNYKSLRFEKISSPIKNNRVPFIVPESSQDHRDESQPAEEVAAGLNTLDNAMGGAAPFDQGDFPKPPKKSRRVRFELPAYLVVQASWFMAFGLQIVLFPYLITQRLDLGGKELGFANMALSAPSVIFLLIGGVVAERLPSRTLLILLHLLAALPAFGLAYAIQVDALSYTLIILYGLSIGTIGAFMMPIRDATVNEVVERRINVGSSVTIQLGVTLATMTQFIGQILGISLAGYADKVTRMPSWLGGFDVGPIASERLLLIQGMVMAIGAVFAIIMFKGKQVYTGRKGIQAAFGDAMDGFRAVRADPRLWAISTLMIGVGIFIIGSFLVVLPILNRDTYGFGPDGLRDMFVTFWFGAAVSTFVLSAYKAIKRQGRWLLFAQLLGVMTISTIVFPVPHEIFLCIVFVWGIAAGISITLSRSIVQAAAPKDQLARVLSVYQLGFMAGAPIGAAMMGYLVDLLGPRTASIIPAVGMGGLIIWVFLFTPVWKFQNKPRES